MGQTQGYTDDYPVTVETIARARAAQMAERARVFAVTGLRVVDRPMPSCALVLVHCPRCTYRAWGVEEQQAMGRLAKHIAVAHLAPTRES